MSDSLIYGKDNTSGIVGLEIVEDKAIIFTQDPEGTVTRTEKPHRYWLLGNENFGGAKRLNGDLHYKFGYQFKNKQELYPFKNKHLGDFYQIYDDKEAHMVLFGRTFFKGLKHNQVSVLAFDIETTGLFHNADSKVLLISNTFRDSKGTVTRKLFAYDEYESDAEFLQAWIDWVVEIDPSVLVAHNGYGYDIPYLQFCCSKVGINLAIGREKKPVTIASYESRFRKDGSQTIAYNKVSIFGRSFLDTMFLSIKYDSARNFTSYGLKNIIKELGLEVDGRVFYEAAKIKDNYLVPEEWAKIKQYAIHDGDDALALYDLMSASLFYLAQSVPKTYQAMLESATGSQINSVMARSYLQDGYSLPKATEAVRFAGAISLGNPGIFRNVLKVDVASLYPSIMIEYGIYDKDKDPKGYFKELVETFTAERLKNKKLAKQDKYYDDLQSAQKLFINSCYGFLGATGLLFNSPSKAALITEKGRNILNSALTWAGERGFQIANGDTDSISFCTGTELSAEEQNGLLADLQKRFPERIKWEHDGYYPTLIVLKAKNYILYDGEKIKIKGSALKSSKTETGLKEFLNEVIDDLVYNKDNLPQIYSKYVREIMDVQDIKRYSSKKTVTEKMEDSERTNEAKLREAIKDANLSQGDKFFVFFNEDDSLVLAENFKGSYNRNKLLKKIHKTSQVFSAVLSTKDLFPDLSLKKNQALLSQIVAL